MADCKLVIEKVMIWIHNFWLYAVSNQNFCFLSIKHFASLAYFIVSDGVPISALMDAYNDLTGDCYFIDIIEFKLTRFLYFWLPVKAG